ncbi:hypothetical protein HK103_000696 [Boothiomyces macroporosus]|uniref:Polyketide cyclase/dehydrase n=1 Tax=Boothiomyces macroporosus TaxID=261099 RepID=A0AAD5Y5T7_9FUNG|nr:hypothetical protein HK103_000696 [Boothiomyces macroporosus]
MSDTNYLLEPSKGLSAQTFCSSGISSMWYLSKKIDIAATPDELWAILTNISQWPTWNPEISRSYLVLPQKGCRSSAKGLVNFGDDKTYKFYLKDLERNKYFGYEIHYTGCTVHTFYEIEDNGAGIDLEAGIIFTGWAAPLYRPFMYEKCNQKLSAVLKTLKSKLEILL